MRRREEFIEFFGRENRVALRDAGMMVFGPMRAFSSLEERDKIKGGFYEGPVWNKRIEPLVMPMIAHYEAELTETTGNFETFSGKTCL